MATTKKTADAPEKDPRGHDSVLEERRSAKENATTVDGSESPSVNPPGDPAEGAKARGGLGI